jgi:hypothetical protein
VEVDVLEVVEAMAIVMVAVADAADEDLVVIETAAIEVVVETETAEIDRAEADVTNQKVITAKSHLTLEAKALQKAEAKETVNGNSILAIKKRLSELTAFFVF